MKQDSLIPTSVFLHPNRLTGRGYNENYRLQDHKAQPLAIAHPKNSAFVAVIKFCLSNG
jgi:predicted amidophosphoribosyltransferase